MGGQGRAIRFMAARATAAGENPGSAKRFTQALETNGFTPRPQENRRQKQQSTARFRRVATHPRLGRRARLAAAGDNEAQNSSTGSGALLSRPVRLLKDGSLVIGQFFSHDRD
jgi:hypothetical protein